MLRWLQALIEQRRPSSSGKPPRRIDQREGWLTFLKTQETETRDSFGLKTFEVVDARIQKSDRSIPQGWISAGGLPNHALAEEWLSFVRQPQHPILPLH
jgi:hypothetical protein